MKNNRNSTYQRVADLTVTAHITRGAKPGAKEVINQIQIVVTRPAVAPARKPIKAGGALLSLAAMSACAAGAGVGRARRTTAQGRHP